MVRPVIATKLYAPRARRGVITRPRLTAQLHRGAEVSVTLVSAPAGFGKTTLLADWLVDGPDHDRCVAWLSLDPADNEPGSFWAYVSAALEGAVPAVTTTAAELLDSSPAPTDRVLTTLLNELAESPGHVWLVLDDYHLVDHPDVGAAMTFFVEHLPPRVHVVLSTRADPNLPLARWRVRGELVEIRAADLRFTRAEAAAYLSSVTGLTLESDQVAVLEERTEGWIAALQLAALSLAGRTDVNGFITRFAGDDRYIVDYLVEEVLAHQADDVRRFLLQSAVPDRFTGSLCDALTGRTDGSAMIRALERANLFVVALDDRREWYRYHQLFADVLRARLLSERPAEALELHRRASRWYEQHDFTEAAIAHALAAGEVGRAIRLIELAVPAIRRHRQEATMHAWLRALPEDEVRRSPVLSLFFGSMLMASGELGGVESWLDDAERALAVGPEPDRPWAVTDDLVTLPSTIAIYRAALAQARGDSAETAQQARRALALAGPDDHLARGGAAGFLAFAAWADGDVITALDTFSQAVESLHAAGSLIDALSGTVVLADLWIAVGRPSEARRLCALALTAAQTHGAAVARAIAELHVALAELDIETGDLHSADRHLEIAADHAAMNESRFRWFVAKALLARAEGDPDGAVALLDQAERLYRPGFFPAVRPMSSIKARIRIGQGQLAEAEEWATTRGLSATDEPRYLTEFDHLTLVRLLLARSAADRDSAASAQAAALLRRAYASAESADRAGSLFEIRLLLALAQDQHGDRVQALRTLEQALRSAPEPAGHRRLFLDEGAPMVSLLRAAERAGIGGDHVRGLLRDGAASEPRTSSPEAPESLSRRELEVLRLLDGDLTGPEIAQALFLSHNTVRTHTKHIFTKLDVGTRRAAVLRARERGLL